MPGSKESNVGASRSAPASLGGSVASSRNGTAEPNVGNVVVATSSPASLVTTNNNEPPAFTNTRVGSLTLTAAPDDTAKVVVTRNSSLTPYPAALRISTSPCSKRGPSFSMRTTHSIHAPLIGVLAPITGAAETRNSARAVVIDNNDNTIPTKALTQARCIAPTLSLPLDPPIPDDSAPNVSTLARSHRS
ncbi:MAG: hypothetical protein BWY17_04935 [Deltaproteobacteria bacterium ADurb.Bin207]|nr:MAG: hypothetical protein BWY17_04935 [Deltaproteobacteria bacterium ADurb.Bin207]